MHDEELKRIWSKGGAGPTLSRADIESLLLPVVRRSTRAHFMLIGTYFLMLVTTVALAIFNLSGYRHNPTMLAVEIGIGVTASLIAICSARLLVELRTAARSDAPLLETTERRLAWIERSYEPWLWFATAVPVLLTFAINSCIDNVNGRYPIHRPFELVLVIAVMLIITRTSLRFATATTIRDLRAALRDVRAQVLDESVRVTEERERHRKSVWLAVGALLLVVGATVGLWLALA